MNHSLVYTDMCTSTTMLYAVYSRVGHFYEIKKKLRVLPLFKFVFLDFQSGSNAKRNYKICNNR